MPTKKHFLFSFTLTSLNSMSPESHLNERSGMLAGGNWIIDQVKIIDVYQKHEQLGNIFDQSQGRVGLPTAFFARPGENGSQFLPWRSRVGRQGQPGRIHSGGLPGARD